MAKNTIIPFGPQHPVLVLQLRQSFLRWQAVQGARLLCLQRSRTAVCVVCATPGMSRRARKQALPALKPLDGAAATYQGSSNARVRCFATNDRSATPSGYHRQHVFVCWEGGKMAYPLSHGACVCRQSCSG
jgi:hypothetical protein